MSERVGVCFGVGGTDRRCNQWRGSAMEDEIGAEVADEREEGCPPLACTICGGGLVPTEDYEARYRAGLPLPTFACLLCTHLALVHVMTGRRLGCPGMDLF